MNSWFGKGVGPSFFTTFANSSTKSTRDVSDPETLPFAFGVAFRNLGTGPFDAPKWLCSMNFPSDFAFQLTVEEFEILRFQFGTSRSWGGRRYQPFVFTEQGVAKASVKQPVKRPTSASSASAAHP